MGVKIFGQYLIERGRRLDGVLFPLHTQQFHRRRLVLSEQDRSVLKKDAALSKLSAAYELPPIGDDRSTVKLSEARDRGWSQSGAGMFDDLRRCTE